MSYTVMTKYFMDDNGVLNRVRIVEDECPLNPREDWDNLGHMICWHSRYDLGDEHNYSVEEFREQLLQWDKNREVEFLPLYLLDHSGITMSTGGFCDPWDSGQVGWIYVRKEEAMKDNPTINEDNWREYAQNIVISEVEAYDMYLRGQVYGVVIEEYDKSGLIGEWEHKDSCYGCFSSEYGDKLFEEICNLAGADVPDVLYDSLEELEKIYVNK